ncbi:MAG: hypothetical protein ACYC5M_16365 [Anaerolineae bacterium]
MNTDIKDLGRIIKIKDPLSAGGIAALLIALILFVLVLVSVVQSTLQLSQMRADYAFTSESVESAVALQSASPDTLMQRVSDAHTEIEAALVDLPTNKQAADELALFYDHASQVQTQLVRMEAMLSSPEELAQTTYRVQHFLLEVQGDIPNLMRFLSRVANGPYISFSIDNISIQPTNPAVANADLTVYSSDLAPGAQPRGAGGAASSQPTDPATEVAQLETVVADALTAKAWATAVSAAERILVLAPEREDMVTVLYQARLSWGRQLVAEGEIDQAREQFQAAVVLQPSGSEAQEVLRTLPTPMPSAQDTPQALAPSGDMGIALAHAGLVSQQEQSSHEVA